MFGGYDRRANTAVAKRVKIFQPAMLHQGDSAARIHLLNLSLTGALAHAEVPPAEGMLVSLASDSERVAARIVWTKGNRFGLAFARSLSPVQAETIAGIRTSCLAEMSNSLRHNEGVEA